MRANRTADSGAANSEMQSGCRRRIAKEGFSAITSFLTSNVKGVSGATDRRNLSHPPRRKIEGQELSDIRKSTRESTIGATPNNGAAHPCRNGAAVDVVQPSSKTTTRKKVQYSKPYAVRKGSYNKRMEEYGMRLASPCEADAENPSEKCEEVVAVLENETLDCSGSHRRVQFEKEATGYAELHDGINHTRTFHTDGTITVRTGVGASSPDSRAFLLLCDTVSIPAPVQPPTAHPEAPPACEPAAPSPVDVIGDFLKRVEKKNLVPSGIFDRVKRDLMPLLRRCAPDAEVLLYGSYAFNCSSATSNLNLAMKTDQPTRNGFLLRVQQVLYRELPAYHVLPLEDEANSRRAKIYFVHTKHGTNCELVYLGNTVGNYVRLGEALKDVCRHDERVRTLLVAVKVWSEACSLSDPESGKLHPVCFTLMMIYFLQQMEKPLLPWMEANEQNWALHPTSDKNTDSVGELWLDFLDFYGASFEWKTSVVSVRGPASKVDKGWTEAFIAIEDPVSEKNAAAAVVDFESADHLRACFSASYAYFAGDVSSSSEEEDRDISSADEGSLEKFSFYSCTQSLNNVCGDSDSDESDDSSCKKVLHLPKQPLGSFSPVDETTLLRVEKVLHQVKTEYALSNENIAGRKRFVQDLECYIQKVYSDAKLTLFGSSVNGFGFKRSDLDICLSFKGKPKQNQLHENTILRTLTRHLRRNSLYDGVVPLYSAQIPIVKFRFVSQKWNCDLSLYNVHAVYNSTLLSKYALMDNRCRILGCALKLLTKKAFIADCAQKTLSSYSYILMTIHYLQQVEPPVLPVLPIHDKQAFEGVLENPMEALGPLNYWYFETPEKLKERYALQEKNTDSVAKLWLGLFEFYLKFDYDRAVNVTEKEPVKSSSLLKSARLFNIEDPFLSKRNLGSIVSEKKADEIYRIFHRSRLFFARQPDGNSGNLVSYFFSPSNLTGRFVKNVECALCGASGHEGANCPRDSKMFRRRRAPFARKA